MGSPCLLGRLGLHRIYGITRERVGWVWGVKPQQDLGQLPLPEMPPSASPLPPPQAGGKPWEKPWKTTTWGIVGFKICFLEFAFGSCSGHRVRHCCLTPKLLHLSNSTFPEGLTLGLGASPHRFHPPFLKPRQNEGQTLQGFVQNTKILIFYTFFYQGGNTPLFSPTPPSLPTRL